MNSRAAVIAFSGIGLLALVFAASRSKAAAAAPTSEPDAGAGPAPTPQLPPGMPLEQQTPPATSVLQPPDLPPPAMEPAVTPPPVLQPPSLETFPVTAPAPDPAPPASSSTPTMPTFPVTPATPATPASSSSSKPAVKRPFGDQPLDVKATASNIAPAKVPASKTIAQPPAAKRSPAQAATELLAYVTPILAAKRGSELGTKGAPNGFVKAAQLDMGGVTADGIYGPTTRTRGTKLTGKPFPVRA